MSLTRGLDDGDGGRRRRGLRGLPALPEAPIAIEQRRGSDDQREAGRGACRPLAGATAPSRPGRARKACAPAPQAPCAPRPRPLPPKGPNPRRALRLGRGLCRRSGFASRSWPHLMRGRLMPICVADLEVARPAPETLLQRRRRTRAAMTDNPKDLPTILRQGASIEPISRKFTPRAPPPREQSWRLNVPHGVSWPTAGRLRSAEPGRGAPRAPWSFRPKL